MSVVGTMKPADPILCADDIIRAGACADSVYRIIKRLGLPAAMPLSAILRLIKFDERDYALRAAEMDGCGAGAGYGYGDSSGSGYGTYGYSSGIYDSGDDSGYGTGYGYSHGDGNGSGDGFGTSYGDGNGSGDCFGYGDGNGSGYSDGYGDSYGEDEGDLCPWSRL